MPSPAPLSVFFVRPAQTAFQHPDSLDPGPCEARAPLRQARQVADASPDNLERPHRGSRILSESRVNDAGSTGKSRLYAINELPPPSRLDSCAQVR